MSSISGNNVASIIAKNYSNLIETEKSAVLASQSAFVETQESNKTAEIGPIYIKLNDPENDTGSVLSDGNSVAERGIYPEGQTRADTLVQRDRQRQRIDYEIKELDDKIAGTNEVFKEKAKSTNLYANGVPPSNLNTVTTESTSTKAEGVSTYVDQNTGITRDAIGREVEVSSGYGLHSPVTYDRKLKDLKLQEVTTDNEFFGSTKTLESGAVAESIEILANNQKVSDEKADEALALLGLEKTNNANIEVDIPYLTDNKLKTLVDEAAESVPFVPYEQDPNDGTSENNITGQTVYNPRLKELEREKADKERAAQAKIDLEKYNRLAFQDALMAEQKKVVPVEPAYEAGVASPNILTEERLQANFKKQEEGFQDVISGTTAADMEDTINLGSANKVTKTTNENAVRNAMEANKKNKGFYNDKIRRLGNEGNPLEKAAKDKLPSFADTRDGSLTGKDPFRFSTLAYPESITTNPQYGHFILFYVNAQNKTKYSYRGYNNDGDEISVGDEYEKFVEDTSGGSQDHRTSATRQGGKFISAKGAREQFGLGDIEYQKQQHLSGKKGNHLRNNQVTLMKARKARAGINSVLDLTTRITDSVAIYLPSAINDNVKAGYQDFNTGFAGFVALSGGKILRNIADNDFEGAAKSFIGKGKDILLDLGKRAAIGAYGGLLSGDGVMESFDKAFGQTVNPFIEVAFDSMGVRTFNYSFDFRPKSSRETEEVKAIIQLFRFHMVPELKGSNHRYMTLPSTFDIHYMYQTNEASKENEFYSKIATCVLQGCDVNYTPDGVKSFESGAPTHITMSLQFMETEMLTKEKVNDGF
jgi:hypothetical protein